MRQKWLVGLFLCVLVLFPSSVMGSTLEGRVIQEVLIEGLPERSNPSPDEFLQLVMETRRGTAANREAITRDAQRLMDSGYFYEVSASLRSLGTDSVVVVFRVNPHPVVRKVHVDGLSVFEPHQILEQMQTRVGSIMSTVGIDEDAHRLNEWFAQQGYPLGRLVSFSMDDTGYLHLLVDEGLVTEVQFVGLQRLSPDALSKSLTLQPGTILTSKVLAETLRKLEAMPRVRRVRDVHYADDPSGMGAVITFSIEEQLTGMYEIGAGYNTQDGFLVYGNIQEADFLMSGRTVGARVRLSQANSLYELQYKDPVTLSPIFDQFAINAYRRQYPLDYSVPDVRETRAGVSLAVSKRIKPTTIVTMGGSFNTLVNGSKKERLVTLDSAWEHSMDSGIANVFMSASLESLGSDFDYVKVGGRIVSEQPLPVGAIAAKLEGGVVSGDAIPLSELFRVGGPGTLRGYRYGSMNGDRMLVLNVEYRTPPLSVLQGIAFVDYGAAWNEGDPVTMKLSYGIGTRIHTPIGALQLSVATDENRAFKLVVGLGDNW